MLDEIFDEQEELVLKELESPAALALLSLGSFANFSSVAPLTALSASSERLKTAMTDIYKVGITDIIAEGLGAQVDQRTVDAAVSSHLSTVNLFNATTQSEIVSALAASSSLDDSNDTPSDATVKAALAAYLIKSVFNKLRKSRKKLIVDSAIVGPYNQGMYDSISALPDGGASVAKQWVSLMDSRVRSDHMELHGKVVPVTSAFYVDGVPIRFPKDPLCPPGLTINCRCVLKFSK